MIDENKLKEQLFALVEQTGDERLHIDAVVYLIDDAPTVDAVLVRCKDCKYFDSGTDEDGKLFFKCLGWVYGGTSEDDFCSHGERKGR